MTGLWSALKDGSKHWVSNTVMKLKLNLKNNALHTLYHAVEHLISARRDTEKEVDRLFHPDTHIIEWKNKSGHLSFYVEGYNKPPARYEYKFALLHLIQASELLMKAHIAEINEAEIFSSPKKTRTIGMRECTKKIASYYPDLLTPGQVSLLFRSKDIRNEIEHFRFDYKESDVKSMCHDLLAIAGLFSMKFYKISLAREFSFDPWRDDTDPVGTYLEHLIPETSLFGRCASKEVASLWALLKPEEQLYLCLNCGAKGASSQTDTCVVCGTLGDKELAETIQDLEEIANQISKLKSKRASNKSNDQ